LRELETIPPRIPPLGGDHGDVSCARCRYANPTRGCNLQYEIHVEDQIGASWSESFDGMHITSGPDGSTIAGDVADRSALHGLLDRVRDFGLTVVSVIRVDPNPQEKS
jgi:hypothetical protein